MLLRHTVETSGTLKPLITVHVILTQICITVRDLAEMSSILSESTLWLPQSELSRCFIWMKLTRIKALLFLTVFVYLMIHLFFFVTNEDFTWKELISMTRQGHLCSLFSKTRDKSAKYTQNVEAMFIFGIWKITYETWCLLDF